MDLMPNMNIPYALVMTVYDGAGPEEIEKLVTKPIEKSVSSVSGLDEITSTSSNGSSIVLIKFTTDTDIDSAAQDVREKIDLIKSTLPDDANEPMVMQIDINSMSSMMISASIEGKDSSEVKKIIDDEIVPRLERVNGVGSVGATGGNDTEIKVVLDQDKIRSYGLTESGISGIITAENLNVPLGNIKQGNKDLTLRVKGEYSSIEEIKELPLTTTSGATIRLSDVAEVYEDYTDTSSVAYTNGANSVMISASKQSTANTVSVSDGILKEIEKLKVEYPQVQFLVISDPADYIRDSLSNVVDSLVKGALLAVVILYIFLRNFKSTIIAAVSMPTSVVFTFAAMKLCGVNFNMMSLGGLTLGVGMLVDNSIVVLESIFQKLEKGVDKYEAATEGAREVTNSVIASTLTNVVVFLPITFVGGTVAELFNDFCLTIIFSVVSSVVVALTFVPMACYLLLTPEDIQRKKSRTLWGKFFDLISAIIDRIRDFYERTLTHALHHRTITIAIAIAAIIFFGSFAANLDFVFMPDADQGEIVIDVDMPSGTRIEETEKMALRVADAVDDFDEITDVSITMGGDSTMSALMGSSSDSATVTIELVSKTERKKSSSQIATEMRKLVRDIAGADITVTASTSAMGTYSSSGVEINIYGDDNDVLKSVANDFLATVKEIPGLTDAETSFESAAPQTTIRIDRDKASLYGISAANVAAMLRTDITGSTPTTYKINDDEYDIRIMQDSDKINYLSDVEGILIPTATGTSVPLADIADIYTEEVPTSITREDQTRYVTITANLDTISSTQANNQISAMLANYSLPDGVTWEFGGSTEQMAESFSDLGLALIMGILMLYMVMAAEFESLTYPLIVLCALPVGMTGALFGCFLMGEPISITSLLGIIVLVGVGVNNAIVLVDYANLLVREQGMDPTEAMRISGPSRFRPVLMSTLTTVIAMLPMMLSNQDGSEMMRGLAIVEVFGLCITTAVTLFIIPAIYSKYTDHLVKKKAKKEARRAKRAAKKAAKEAAAQA
jgi:HAE1 family hydrophobic/amphiphilic exporter-1